MKINRRRFLTISAAMIGAPAWAAPHTWQGRALGADVSLTIKGASAETVAEVPKILARIESLFSLYDDRSALSRLNADGMLENPDPQFITLLNAADHAYRITGGLFDPTVQPLWRALATGQDLTTPRASVGWNRVTFDQARIQLGTNQALTFNGIAQGFATDIVTAYLHAQGLTETLVNIGEYRAIGGPWRLGIDDPTHGQLATRTLQGNAIATSSPSALSLGKSAHILHPNHSAQWSTVSIEATTATRADSLSTALCLAPRELIAEVRKADDVQRITLVDFDGDLITI